MISTHDLSQIFSLGEVSLIELIIRASSMYLGVFILLRVVSKRQRGNTGVSDILMVVLIADAAQSGLTGGYNSVTAGLVSVAVIIFWTFFLDFLGFYFPWVRKFLEPGPLLLIQDGKMLKRNMKRELITEGEILAHLRKYGIEDLQEVHEAYMEDQGDVTVIKKLKPNQK